MMQDLDASLLEMIQCTGALYVGYSGGADSTLLLRRLSLLYPQRVCALHLSTSSIETDFCKKQTDMLGLPIYIKTGQRASMDAMRRQKYALYRQHVRAGDVCLTGHNRDDAVENVIIRLTTRGSVVTHISPRSIINSCHIIRPLLSFRRSEIIQMLHNYKYDYIESVHNQSLTNRRNYIRHRVIPKLLQHVHTHATDNIFQSSVHIQSLHDTVTALMNIAWKHYRKNRRLSISDLRQLDACTLSVIVRQFIISITSTYPSSGVIHHTVSMISHNTLWRYRYSAHHYLVINQTYLLIEESK